MNYRWTGALALAAALTACVTAGPGLGSSSAVPASRVVKSLYVRPGVMQYFLLPQRLEGPAGRYAELDIVVRDSANTPIFSLLHLSLMEPPGFTFGPTDTLLVHTGSRLMAVAPPRVLYTEQQRKGQLTRLEIPLSPAQVAAYLRAPSPHALAIGRPGVGRLLYQPGKKAAKHLQAFTAVAIP